MPIEIETTNTNPSLILGVMDPKYPATVEDIIERSGKERSFIEDALKTLLTEEKVISKEIGGFVFYRNVDGYPRYPPSKEAGDGTGGLGPLEPASNKPIRKESSAGGI